MKPKQGRVRYVLLSVGFLVSLLSSIALAAPELDPAMQATWERSDRLVASGAVPRSWLWGPQALHVLKEPYNGGRRLVAYFDKVDFEYDGDPPNVHPKRYIKNDVLIQLFERRVLTHTPSNPDEWRVEMGNTGKHYYIWRYEYPYR